MNNSMQGAFDLTDIFSYPPVKKSTENPPYALKKTQHSIIIKGGIGLNTNDEKIQWHPADLPSVQYYRVQITGRRP